MIKVTHIGEDYSTIEVDGKAFQASLGLGEAILAVLGSCKACGEPMHTLVRSHHHTKDNGDVTS